MIQGDPFRVPERPVRLVVSEDATSPPTCGWLLPLPEDAERGTKPEKCGDPAPFRIRVKDAVSDVEVDVCPRHKAQHDEKAASLRQKAKRGTQRRAG